MSIIFFMARGNSDDTQALQKRQDTPFILDKYLNSWAADWDLFSEKTLDLIIQNAEEVERISRTDLVLDCGEASSAWYRVFYEAKVPVRMLKGAYHDNLNNQGQVEDRDGGITSPPLGADHVWLEVEGHLLDPTAGQFVSQTKPFDRRNYFIEEYYDSSPGGEEEAKAWEIL